MINRIIERLEDLRKSVNSKWIVGEAIVIVKEESKNNGWIPVSEPPKEDDTYIVAWVPLVYPVSKGLTHYYGLFDYDSETDDWSIDVPDNYKENGIEILAWKPLPAPYKNE